VRLRGIHVPGAAVYPPAFAAAVLINQFTSSSAPVEALVRPLAVVVLGCLAVQAIVTLVLGSADRAGYVCAVAVGLILGITGLTLLLVAGLAVFVVLAIRDRRAPDRLPWRQATGFLNVVGIVVLGLAIAAAIGAGAFVPATADSRPAARGSAVPGSPDIYLILLDGYPRADTLAKTFGYDNGPFLRSMESMGFDVATNSHSNYDMTVLTLASMLNAAQMPTLVPSPPAEIFEQFRVATRLINRASAVDGLRQAGYEIVTVPSEYQEAALFTADRVLESGNLTSFETNFLSSGNMPQLFGALERSLVPEEHRARIANEFDTLERLAAERSAVPKFVFAHILAPHMPITFTSDGGPAEPLPCFPNACSLFDLGDRYGDALLPAERDQIEYLNTAVEKVVRTIQARSATPPVIVIFSDHGVRNHEADQAETLRSIFLAATPGHTDVFPDDVTPVNVLPRLLEAYTAIRLPLATEESYWVDIRQVLESGPLNLQRVVVPPD
jgi:hypothetical protein